MAEVISKRPNIGGFLQWWIDCRSTRASRSSTRFRSVLGPLLFNLYTVDVSLVVAQPGLQLYQYADDCQVYVSALVDEASTTVARLSRCITDVAG